MPRKCGNGICEEPEDNHRPPAAANIDMRSKILFALTVLAAVSAWLNIGFYETHFAEVNQTVFFIKKRLTFQIKFENIFLRDEDDKPLDLLESEQQQLVIDYCKYRLGIETKLKTQEELDACKQR
ncbi:hypothetical protein D9M70_553890 [compost metagenome]